MVTPKQILMNELCSYCGKKCLGKLRIEVFRNKYYPFCSSCFNIFQDLDMSLLRKVFKNNENFITKQLYRQVYKEHFVYSNMKRTIKVEEKTARRIQRAKYKLGYKTADETINKVFDIVEKIAEAQE